jgi:hypothetical protein
LIFGIRLRFRQSDRHAADHARRITVEPSAKIQEIFLSLQRSWTFRHHCEVLDCRACTRGLQLVGSTRPGLASPTPGKKQSRGVVVLSDRWTAIADPATPVKQLVRRLPATRPHSRGHPPYRNAATRAAYDRDQSSRDVPCFRQHHGLRRLKGGGLMGSDLSLRT